MWLEKHLLSAPPLPVTTTMLPTGANFSAFDSTFLHPPATQEHIRTQRCIIFMEVVKTVCRPDQTTKKHKTCIHLALLSLAVVTCLFYVSPVCPPLPRLFTHLKTCPSFTASPITNNEPSKL